MSSTTKATAFVTVLAVGYTVKSVFPLVRFLRRDKGQQQPPQAQPSSPPQQQQTPVADLSDFQEKSVAICPDASSHSGTQDDGEAGSRVFLGPSTADFASLVQSFFVCSPNIPLSARWSTSIDTSQDSAGGGIAGATENNECVRDAATAAYGQEWMSFSSLRYAPQPPAATYFASLVKSQFVLSPRLLEGTCWSTGPVIPQDIVLKMIAACEDNSDLACDVPAARLPALPSEQESRSAYIKCDQTHKLPEVKVFKAPSYDVPIYNATEVADTTSSSHPNTPTYVSSSLPSDAHVISTNTNPAITPVTLHISKSYCRCLNRAASLKHEDGRVDAVTFREAASRRVFAAYRTRM